MESSNKFKKAVSKKVNYGKGLKTSAYICGIIAIGASIGALVPEITTSPALAEIQEGLKWAAYTATFAEAPILTIMGINGEKVNLLRKIGGSKDCAILEINKKREQRNGISQAMLLTTLVAGISALGMVLSDKDMPKILEFITKLKEEFMAGVVTATAAVILELLRILDINAEINLIKDTFNVSNNDVWDANVRNGERGAKRKSLVSWVGDKVRNIRNKKESKEE